MSKEKSNAQRRKGRLKIKGWTIEMYDQTFKEQGGRCAICRLAPEGYKKAECPSTAPLNADHSHTEPPQPRALLCHPCNIALGLLRDSPETCRAAAEYLEAWS